MEQNKIKLALDPYFKGIGQIMLQENALTGLLFVIGILVNSPLMALGTIVGTVAGTMTAKLLKYDKANIESGLYGFNAALVGVAHIALFETTVMIWVSLILMSAASSIIMNFALTKKIPVFTFPFIGLTWIAMVIFNRIFGVPDPVLSEVHADQINAVVTSIDPNFSIFNHGFGFGEVIFQSSLISGIIFFIAVYMSSPNAAIYGFFGAIFGMTVAVFAKGRIDDVTMGMFSFNAVLCAIVFAGPKKKDILFVMLAIAVSGLTEEFMLRMDFAVLTFPFVFGTWVTLIVRDKIVKRYLPSAFV